MKKSLAVLLAAVMTLSFLPLFAGAQYKGAPTSLYVGEVGKTEDNLIEMYKETKEVRVYSVYESESYYELKNEGTDSSPNYVLTFYGGYKNSDLVKADGISAVVYCDGDLTIRVDDKIVKDDKGNETVKGTVLDANGTFPNTKADSSNAYGVYVLGTLNLEGTYDKDGNHTPGTLTVNGSLDRPSGKSVKGHVGVYADSILVYGDTVYANGGRAAFLAEDVFGMIDATIYANRDKKMIKKSGTKTEYLFEYSIDAPHYVQASGMTSAAGNVNIKTFHAPAKSALWTGNEFDEQIVVYTSAYEFDQEEYDGKWMTSWKLFYNPSTVPDCMKIVFEHSGNYCAKVNVSANSVRAQAVGSGTLSIWLRCGTKGEACLSTSTVNTYLKWWQWPLYLMTFTGLRILLANTFKPEFGLGSSGVETIIA